MHCGLLGCDTTCLLGGYYALYEEHIAGMYRVIIPWSQYGPVDYYLLTRQTK